MREPPVNHSKARIEKDLIQCFHAKAGDSIPAPGLFHAFRKPASRATSGTRTVTPSAHGWRWQVRQSRTFKSWPGIRRSPCLPVTVISHPTTNSRSLTESPRLDDGCATRSQELGSVGMYLSIEKLLPDCPVIDAQRTKKNSLPVVYPIQLRIGRFKIRRLSNN
jgi:hypothetical protein